MLATDIFVFLRDVLFFLRDNSGVLAFGVSLVSLFFSYRAENRASKAYAFQLERDEYESLNRSSAMISLSIIKKEKNHYLHFENTGECTAKNVRVDFLGGEKNYHNYHKKIPRNSLRKGDYFDILIVSYIGFDFDAIRVKVIWDDDLEKDREEELQPSR